MSLLKNNEIEQLQYDYVNGFNRHGSVLARYSKVLQEFKKLYSSWHPFYGQGINEKMVYNEEMAGLKKRKIKNIVFSVIMLLLFIIDQPGGLIWSLFSFGAMSYSILKSKERKEDKIWVAFPVFIVPIAFVCWLFRVSWATRNNLCSLVFLAFYAIYLLIAVKEMKDLESYIKSAHEENKRDVIQLKKIEEQLDAKVKELADLYPELETEYRTVLQEKVKQNNLSDDIYEHYKDLPETFWWEIPPIEFDEQEFDEYTDLHVFEFDFSHDIVAVERKSGEEMQIAKSEYSPLYAEDELESRYQDNMMSVTAVNGGIILEFIDGTVTGEIKTRTYEYQDYAESGLKRFAKTMEWNSLGSDIDYAYKQGDISASDYSNLKGRYNMESYDVHKAINRKETKIGEEEYEAKEVTFVWAGQMLLYPDEFVKGSYVLADYRCQKEFLYENLNILYSKGYKISKVLCNNTQFDPIVMAKLHHMYPEMM